MLCLAAAPIAGQEREAAELARGWALLGQGRPADAGAVAAKLISANPRSGAALSLGLEAALATGGVTGGLQLYERWLRERQLEEPAAVRRIARAVLQHASEQTTDVAARAAALAALAQDGDRAAAAEMKRLTGAEGGVSARMLAMSGDPEAVRALSEGLERKGGGEGVLAIEALGRSGSREAIDPLAARLSDERSEIRAAAAEALGRLAAKDQAPALQGLLSDRNTNVRLKAAGALLSMGDESGLAVLREFAAHESASVRLGAAESLAARPDAAWRALVNELTSAPEIDVQIGAARLLFPHDPQRALSILNAFASHDNLVYRELAARAAGEADVRDLGALRHLLKTSHALGRVRAAARVLAVTR